MERDVGTWSEMLVQGARCWYRNHRLSFTIRPFTVQQPDCTTTTHWRLLQEVGLDAIVTSSVALLCTEIRFVIINVITKIKYRIIYVCIITPSIQAKAHISSFLQHV